MDFITVLERIGPTQEEVIINKNLFYCGRSKDSDLICLSLLVSRSHCLFTTLSDGLYVTDQGSANGVFVNGIPIRQKKALLLNENDYIGIGCANLSNLDGDTMFVYKVKRRAAISNNTNNTDAVNNNFVINGEASVRLARKEQSKQRILNTSSNLPSKISKLDAVYQSVNGNTGDDDDIEIIECSSTSNAAEQITKAPNVIKEEKKVCTSTSASIKQKAENQNLINKIVECYNTLKPKQQETKIPHSRCEATAILPDIVDITDDDEGQLCSVNKNSRDRINPDLMSPVHNLKNEPMQTDSNDLGAIQSNALNIKEEMPNIDELDPLSAIKQEIEWGCFSQIDLVEINNEDTNKRFPSSQLFDKTVIKKELQDNDDYGDHVDNADVNNIPQTSLFLDDDDENVITILDSDDECPEEISMIMVDPLRIKLEPNIESESVQKATSPPAINELNIADVNNTNIVTNSYTSAECITTDESSYGFTNLGINLEHITSNNNLNVPTNEVRNSSTSLEFTVTRNDKIVQSEDQPSSSHDDPLTKPSTSNDTQIVNKTKRKGVEIVEPHFMKPTKKSERNDKKSEKKSKGKDESSKKHSDKNYSSEESSKRNKDKKNKDNRSSKSSSRKSSSSNSKSSKKDKEHESSKKPGSSSKKDKDSTNVNVNDKNNENRDRNDSKLRQNESSANETLNQTRPRPRTTNVKVKVSSRSRGDMLAESFCSSMSKPQTNTKKSDSVSAKTVTSKTVTKPNDVPSYVIPRRQVPSSTLNKSLSMPRQINTASSTSTSTSTLSSKEIPTTILTNATNTVNLATFAADSNERRSPQLMAEPMINNDNDHDNYNEFTVPPTLKPSLVIPSVLNTSQKKVSFKENIVAVREFPIEAGHQLRHIKNGLSIRSTRKDFAVSRVLELKIEDFLARVFVWEPVWLEQQQKVKMLPPIVKQADMQILPKTFNSFEKYYKQMEVLLLLETWQQLLKEYECTGNRYSSSIVLPCRIVKHSIRQMQTPNGLRYSMLVINTLISKKDLRMQYNPVYGDMIILEYTIKQGDAQKMRRAFAYVVHVQQQNSLKFLRSDPKLSEIVENPEALLTYTVQTRIIDEHAVQFEQVARLRSILYLRSHLRLIQGLQFVPHSALRDSILNCDIDEFQLDPVTMKQIKDYQLVTKENLNERQMEAVIKFTNAAIKLEPKIGLLIGPPGTGKSKVIANLVTQILYGDGRYVAGRPLRILVCAPSNAAIDEIVLRLLDIRGAIKEHRFKMVRIGRMESMHEEVKKISLTELAKREVQKTHSDQQHKRSENIELEKHKLSSDIKALEQLAASFPDSALYRRDLANMKARFTKLVHKTPEQEAVELSRLQNSAKTVILQKANVIACTLSSCYTSQMETIFGGNSEKIATCIVDEATQCCEAETLIPLMLGVKSLILVGDPNQLPATVMSTDAKRLGLDRSLFTRAKEALGLQINNSKENQKDPVITLNVQYRMVNAISHWPNKYFYGGNLIDMVNYRQTFPFQPYRILNLDGLQDDIKFSNTSEAVFVGNLINCLMTSAKLHTWDKTITVGIITPYQNQKSVILSTIREQTRDIPDKIKHKFITEVNTIDSFQGQERDVIIMSCVRSSGIGFLSDQQRLCVALTRAKFTLILCGNFNTFQKDNTWKDLLKDARSRGVVAHLNTTARPNEIKPHVVR